MSSSAACVDDFLSVSTLLGRDIDWHISHPPVLIEVAQTPTHLVLSHHCASTLGKREPANVEPSTRTSQVAMTLGYAALR